METDPARMAALMLGVLDVATVADVIEDGDGVRAVLELEGELSCPDCGSQAVAIGVVEVEQTGGSMFGRPLVRVWRLRSWLCQGCGREGTEEVPALKG